MSLHCDPAAELPDDLADAAAERLLAHDAPQRGAVLAELVAAHPQHASALRRLSGDLGGVERLLGGDETVRLAEALVRIGDYRVIRRLGEGAFGVVYLCAQDEPLVRQVAIKVLGPGAGDERTLRRFAAERQMLATLNHPAITQVFDAGVLPDGRPFFVMEYVDGPTIRQYCTERALDCGQRLELFVALCRGVAHAHTRGIVHRDLKPSNVLVVETEAGPLPKIIDFGIAKALVGAPVAAELRTDPGRVIGTPGYMSPEQAAGRVDEIDQRADVFALGVMLYELLAGELPWARGAAATDTEPVRPSLRITTATTHATCTPAERRHLAAALRGDLDWVVLKALARERDERYASVLDLAADLERHGRGEPVSVGPPSAIYRLRKFVRRNRPWVVAVGAATAVLAIGLAFAIGYGSDARAEVADARQAAAASFADANAVLERLIERANDDRLRAAPQSDATRQALLHDALSFYDRFSSERPTDPQLRVGRCDALLAISQLHYLLGELPRATSAAAAVVEESRSLLAASPDVIAYRGLLGEGLRKQGRAMALGYNYREAHGRLAEAVTHLGICAAAAPAGFGRSHAAALREAAGTLESHRVDERLAGMHESLAVLAMLRRVTPDDVGVVEDEVQCRAAIAQELLSVRRFDEAATMLAQAAATLPTLGSGKARLTYSICRLQGMLTEQRGDRKAAVRDLQKAADAAAAWQREQPHRVQPQDVLHRALQDLGHMQNYIGAFADSTASYRAAIALAEATVVQFPEDPKRRLLLCGTLRDFAWTLRDRFRQEDLAEAAACMARALAVDAGIPTASGIVREPRWRLLAMQALITESRGSPGSPPGWPEVISAMPADWDKQGEHETRLWIDTRISLGRWHLANGRPAEAEASRALAESCVRATSPLHDKNLVEIGWLGARLAAGRGEHAEVAAAATAILESRNTWFSRRRAADCLHLAWRCAVAAGAAEDVGAEYRDRAGIYYAAVRDSLREDVEKAPEDPWFVVPWASAGVRGAELALAAGDESIARELLEHALPRLEAIRAFTHADQWDEAVWVAGRQLAANLQPGAVGR